MPFCHEPNACAFGLSAIGLVILTPEVNSIKLFCFVIFFHFCALACPLHHAHIFFICYKHLIPNFLITDDFITLILYIIFSAFCCPRHNFAQPDVCSGSGSAMLLLHHHQQAGRVQQRALRLQPVLPGSTV